MDKTTSSYVTCEFGVDELRELLGLPPGEITAAHIQHGRDIPTTFIVVIKE